MSALTRPAPIPPVVQRLRACAADPMWADHAEVSKRTLTAAADEIEALIGELCHAQMEASGACAELSSAAIYGEVTYAVRDAKLAAGSLVRLQQHIASFLDSRTICVAISDCRTLNLCLSVGTCKGKYVLPASMRTATPIAKATGDAA